MTQNEEQKYNIICQLTRNSSFIEGDYLTFAKEVIKLTYSYFSCKRMSFWTIDQDEEKIICRLCFENEKFIKGQSQPIVNTPTYFKNLKASRTLYTSDARLDPKTKELSDIYLIPEGLAALLDSAVYDGNEVVGILSLEDQTTKIWTHEEINFARVLTDLISNCFVLNQRIKAERELIKNKIKLEETNLTLKNVLSKIEDEKKVQMENVAINIEQNIAPLLYEIKEKVGDDFYKQFEGNLSTLTSSFYRRLAKFNYNLTPTEIKICHLIKSGFQGKEIANSLNLSFHTVETHKKNIRRKLGLTGRPINLKVALEEINSSPSD